MYRKKPQIALGTLTIVRFEDAGDLLMPMGQKVANQQSGTAVIVIHDRRRRFRYRQRRVEKNEGDTHLFQPAEQIEIRIGKRCFGSFQQNAGRGIAQQFREELPFFHDAVSCAELPHGVAGGRELCGDVPQELRIKIFLRISRDDSNLPEHAGVFPEEIGTAAADPDNQTFCLQKREGSANGLAAAFIAKRELGFTRELCFAGAAQLNTEPPEFCGKNSISGFHLRHLPLRNRRKRGAGPLYHTRTESVTQELQMRVRIDEIITKRKMDVSERRKIQGLFPPEEENIAEDFYSLDILSKALGSSRGKKP